MKTRILLVISYWLLVIGLTGCEQKPIYKEARFLMGTIVEVTSEDSRAATIVFNEIARIENLLSKYKEYSEVTHLNRQGNLRPSPETIFIIKKSKEFWQITGGAFDITAAPLVDLWGFTNREYRVPENSEINRAFKLVGSDKIIIDEKNNLIKFKLKGMKVDLGGIAKGYAVDCAVKKLKEAGVKSALINAGGQIYCLGDNRGRFWKVAVQNPRGKGCVEYIELKDKAVATSGDYEQYFKVGEKRYSHIIDPKTGSPTESGVISVTVVADDGLTVDAMSTSIFILGKDKGEVLAKKFSAEVINIITEENVKY